MELKDIEKKIEKEKEFNEMILDWAIWLNLSIESLSRKIRF